MDLGDGSGSCTCIQCYRLIIDCYRARWGGGNALPVAASLWEHLSWWVEDGRWADRYCGLRQDRQQTSKVFAMPCKKKKKENVAKMFSRWQAVHFYCIKVELPTQQKPNHYKLVWFWLTGGHEDFKRLKILLKHSTIVFFNGRKLESWVGKRCLYKCISIYSFILASSCILVACSLMWNGPTVANRRTVAKTRSHMLKQRLQHLDTDLMKTWPILLYLLLFYIHIKGLCHVCWCHSDIDSSWQGRHEMRERRGEPVWIPFEPDLTNAKFTRNGFRR